MHCGVLIFSEIFVKVTFCAVLLGTYFCKFLKCFDENYYLYSKLFTQKQWGSLICQTFLIAGLRRVVHCVAILWGQRIGGCELRC